MASNHHLIEAQRLLAPDDQGSGYAPPPSPETVALAQVHVLMQVAHHLGSIDDELTAIREAISNRE